MKASSFSITFFLALQALSVLKVNSQGTDSCNSNLNLNLPFNTSSLNCLSVWSRHDFILRYVQTSSNVWSFVLSAPDTNSFVGMGFSSDGQMVGSSAVVGWISADGTGTMKQYFLGGQRPNLVIPDEGNLTIVENSTSITSQSSRVYMAFQLSSSQPRSRVLYSVGQIGVIPSSPGFALAEHRDKVSTRLNYVTGTTSATSSPHSRLRKSHGILNMVSWGILMLIGAIVGRYFRQWDPLWFYAHLLIQSCSFLLGISGIITGFILEDRLSVDVDTHKALGIFILVLGCLQVMAVFARPGKESKLRKYWNWYHHNGGRILMGFAIANVFYGIHLGGEGTAWNASYAVVISILFLVSLVLEFNLWRKN
ncbi:Cytochrome b561 and DOMON domain-containing protein [Hibiscus syriacus]|uniref:Cytochrome b561 and DOMON domain-containing protein n=1 Tax=Hibiscus syriacus TaxID=106335 RepID=A0A6A2WRG2_HIBSY|nr:cytochrome b561 and DOMON domain-containing protein At3g07570-like [Hibiscus syriacus]KAE8663258.1 Cytochrome b561 and DOMON domain-containing protein [Hibiscus syriacus]